MKQVEAPPDVSQAPGLLQAREKMEGQGLDFPQEPLPCSGTAREGSGQGRADTGHVSTRVSSGRGGLGGGVTETAHSAPFRAPPGPGTRNPRVVFSLNDFPCIERKKNSGKWFKCNLRPSSGCLLY